MKCEDSVVQAAPDSKAQQRPSTKHKRTWRKVLLMVSGVIALLLGTVGIFVPLLPTTPFLLLAGACFIRSSERLYNWLIHHRWFGTYIYNYRTYHAIPLSTKILTIILLWSTIIYTSLAVVESWIIRGLLLIIALGVTLHLAKLKTLRSQPGSEQSHQAPPIPDALSAAQEEL